MSFNVFLMPISFLVSFLNGRGAYGGSCWPLPPHESRVKRIFVVGRLKLLCFFVLSPFSIAGCCFVTVYTRKAALKAQDALHNIKTLAGVSKKETFCAKTCDRFSLSSFHQQASFI